MKMELTIPPEIVEAVAREVAALLSPVLETRGVCPRCRGAKERKEMTHGEVWIDEKAVSLRTGLSVQTLRNLRCKREGPVYYKVNGRSVRYKEADVKAWVEAFKIFPR